jgi:hypothetical protein
MSPENQGIFQLLKEVTFRENPAFCNSMRSYPKSIMQSTVVRCLTNDLQAVFFLLNRYIADSTFILCVEFEIVIV